MSVEPHLSFIFIPFGWLPITNISAPNSDNTVGAILYEAPFAQSTTIFIPSRDRLLGKVFFKNCIYLCYLYVFPQT